MIVVRYTPSKKICWKKNVLSLWLCTELKHFSIVLYLFYGDIVIPGHFKVDRNFNFSTPYSLKRLKG